MDSPKTEAARTTYNLVSSESDLDDIAASAKGAGRVGLDTEFMRERTYRARLCLVQLALDDNAHIVDPTRGIGLNAIAPLIESEDVEVVVHAGRQDFEILFDQLGCLPRRVYDVQIAAGFAGYGGSLPYGRLVEATLGVSLVKGESYTDWCQRPLSKSQLRYAADDVVYILRAADVIDARLRDLGRREWVEEEMKALEDPALYEPSPRSAWKRISGRGTLTDRQMAILVELAAWREEAAATRDLPRGWIVKDQVLVELARRAPTDVGGIKAVRGIGAREADRFGREIIAAIRRGREAKPIAKVRAPSRELQGRARVLAGLADSIVRGRCQHAGISPELVATRDELEALLVELITGSLDDSRHRILQGWRGELAGRAVIDLAEGRLAVKAIPDPPYVEEVPL